MMRVARLALLIVVGAANALVVPSQYSRIPQRSKQRTSSLALSDGGPVDPTDFSDRDTDQPYSPPQGGLGGSRKQFSRPSTPKNDPNQDAQRPPGGPANPTDFSGRDNDSAYSAPQGFMSTRPPPMNNVAPPMNKPPQKMNRQLQRSSNKPPISSGPPQMNKKPNTMKKFVKPEPVKKFVKPEQPPQVKPPVNRRQRNSPKKAVPPSMRAPKNKAPAARNFPAQKQAPLVNRRQSNVPKNGPPPRAIRPPINRHLGNVPRPNQVPPLRSARDSSFQQEAQRTMRPPVNDRRQGNVPNQMPPPARDFPKEAPRAIRPPVNDRRQGNNPRPNQVPPAQSVFPTQDEVPPPPTEHPSGFITENFDNDDKFAASRVQSVVRNSKSLNTNMVQQKNAKTGKYIKATVSGLAVALAMVPEGIAFSFVAGVNPLVGLWTTVMLGFTAAAIGGRAGICSSASGACSVVIASLTASHGLSYVSATALLCGFLQILGGVLGFGKFIRLVPHPVMLGFVNGLALVMTRSQLVHFTVARTGKFVAWNTPAGSALYGITALTMGLVKLWPRLCKKIAKLGAIPPSLAAVILSTVAAKSMRLPVKTLADVAGKATFKGGLSVVPKLALPRVPFNMATLKIILPYAMTMAAVGCIESLLTMQLVDGMVDDGKRGSTRRECFGQGTGNVVAGMTGGIGGCALLGQSIINVQSGGAISRWSGMSMALFLAAGIVACAPLLGSVPVASLVGVMLVVCQSTFSWSSLRILRKIPRLDAAVIGLVSVATVKKDLAFAVVLGTIASALGFAWKQSTSLTASTTTQVGGKMYSLRGPLFFGSTDQFQSIFSPSADPDNVLLDFSNTRVMDHSALEAINDLANQYKSRGKMIILRRLSNDCIRLLEKLNNKGSSVPYVIQADPNTDPVYGVAEEAEAYADVPIRPGDNRFTY